VMIVGNERSKPGPVLMFRKAIGITMESGGCRSLAQSSKRSREGMHEGTERVTRRRKRNGRKAVITRKRGGEKRVPCRGLSKRKQFGETETNK
jgi:hypothetical protein